MTHTTIDEVTELELQACGLEKKSWTFGYGNSVYKDAHNTYLVDPSTNKAWFHYRNDTSEVLY